MNNGQDMAQDVKSKRQQILDAAYKVFSQKGYYRATIDEIIELADTGKGTVYNYFSNKEKLFYTVITERSTPFKATIRQINDSDQASLDKIEAMIKVFLQFYVGNADLWRVLMHEMRGFGGKGSANFSAEQREKYREEFRSTVGLLGQALKEGIEQGVIRPCDVMKSAHGLFSVIMMMVFQKFVDENNIEDTAQNIADIFFNGVASR